MQSFLLCLIGLTASLRIEHEITNGEGNSGFYAVGAFCFDVGTEAEPQAGHFDFRFDFDTDLYSTVDLYFFSDQDEHWGMIFNDNTGNYIDGMDCAEKLSYASGSITGIGPGQQTSATGSGINTLEQIRRPRFWYFVVANCPAGNVAGITVTGELLNDIHSQPVNYEFSVNQQGLQIMYFFFLVVYCLYLPFNGLIVHKLKKENNGAVHQFVQLFCIILAVQFIAVCLYMHHFWTFKNDGVGHIAAYYFAQGVELIARVFFVVLLMFMAEGWTIRQGAISLEYKSKMAILCSLTSVLVINLCLLLWAYFAVTPNMVRPVLVQRVFTYILLAFWVVFGMWFIKTCIKSYTDMDNETGSTEENISAKKRLFLLLAVLYGFWILSLPVTTYVALLLDPWVYDVVVHTVSMATTTVGFFFFTAILVPPYSNKYFEPPSRGVTIGGGDYNRL